ncbi:hypothetical protein AU197_14440 [Mycobacterium sp. IS-1590]|uniref:hypothetical protein n=1 Tax=Mycobacterium sp. IS-1590 TaxID=1772286 RepID=UPI000748F315|nr:hypothetical protein [Mycobacterium sp. IS-1590]KUI42309.1 hypothetical protein AU197_14440 [Mycobacterium sp. IS-1590]
MITDSTASEWHRINRIGSTYRYRFGSWTGPGDTSGIETDSHSEVAVYMPDIDLTIAYGMPESAHREGLNFEWSKAFPDQEIRHISIVDVFWRGSLVDRINYVYVDGARCILPLGEGHQGLRITRYDYSVARLLDELAGHRGFERYYNQVPYELID